MYTHRVTRVAEWIKTAPSERGPVPADGFVGLWRKSESRNRCVFKQRSPTPLRPYLLLPVKMFTAQRRRYPVDTGNASIRRTMLPNNRRVRWLSASISQ